MSRIPAYCAIPFFIAGCSDKEHETEKNHAVSRYSQWNEKKTPKVETMNVRDSAVSNFDSFWITDAKDLEKYSAQINEFTEKLEKSEKLSRGDARNEIFLTLTDKQPEQVKDTVKRGFAQVILNDPRGAAAAIGELPAGDLRRSSISHFRGTKTKPDEFAELYHAMPESVDRSKIAERLVSRTYFELGAERAIEAIRSLESEDERKRALESLAGQMSGASEFGTRVISPEDIEKIKAYAKSVGQDRFVRELERLPAAKP